MNILGIIYHGGFFGHPSACLLQNGKLVAFVEEERLVRVKQAKGYFPSKSIAYCLKKGNIDLNDVDYIAFGWDCHYYKFKYTLFLMQSFLKHRLFKKKSPALRKISSDRPNIGSGIISGLESFINYHPKAIKQKILFGLNDAGYSNKKIPPIIFVKHHLSHAASAFYSSDFEKSAILVFDGHGEQNTITIFKGEGKEIKLLKEINIPHSIGWFYSAFTEYLGWDPNEGEVKLMGLAPYGSENIEIKKIIEDVLVITGDGIKLNTDYIFYNKRSYGEFFSDLLVEKLGKPRGKNEDITKYHKDIAFAVQTKMEEAGLFLSKKSLDLAESKNLCLVGGVALNCKMNGVIHKNGYAENIFVQPISYDAGVSIGAAMVVAIQKGDDCRFKMEHVFFGPAYSNDEINNVLTRNKLQYEYKDDIAKYGATLISEGKIIGWFQNQMEAGPRALGGRSIIADPRDPAMKDKVNDYVKFRENWRPFALSILEEYIKDYLEKPVSSPFMAMAFDVTKDKIKDLQSAMHLIDNTTRPQSVSKKTNPAFWELIDQFRKLTGLPAVLNTSFNIKGEPIVCSPDDAIRCFYGTGIDVLIIGNFIVRKK